MSALQVIIELVERFEQNKADYRRFVRADLLGRDLPDDIPLYLESLDD